ncbi:hypothetical protein [Streptomyces sp. M2CJ-2]|nr:hypothetical protein [Streptomyces sp. M2CJ-2]
MKYGTRTDARPMIEILPLDQGREAYDRMMAVRTRFRAVLKVSE